MCAVQSPFFNWVNVNAGAHTEHHHNEELTKLFLVTFFRLSVIEKQFSVHPLYNHIELIFFLLSC